MSWRHLSCRRCGYQMVMDICGCIIPLCNPPSQAHIFETLEETYDREKASDWKKN